MTDLLITIIKVIVDIANTVALLAFKLSLSTCYYALL